MSHVLPRGLPDVDADTSVVFLSDQRLASDVVAGLCEEVRGLLMVIGPETVVCDVGRLGAPTIGHVEVLARLELAARRGGGRIRLRHPGPGLRALLDLVGLRIEVEGETEQREPALRVQEEVEPGEPPP